jgi:hypothetical protein
MCDDCNQTESPNLKQRADCPAPPRVPPGMSEEERINELFGHKFPTYLTGPKFETIREAARHFAKLILMNVPSGSDRYIAIQKIREAVFLASSGIANDGLSL